MKRDELVDWIRALPAGADVGVRIGGGHLQIVDVVPWGGGEFGAVICRPVDFRDLLAEWGLSVEQRKRIMSRAASVGEDTSTARGEGVANGKVRIAGIDEIQVLLGASDERMRQLAEGAGFPEPLAVLDSGKVWDLDDVDEWRGSGGKAE